MGYTTKFLGAFTLSRKLTFKEAKILLDVYEIQHNQGIEGAHPEGYLQWVPTEDLKHIIWDDEEKFYNYVQWLRWLIEEYLSKWGIFMNGQVSYSGEDADDNGIITIDDNVIERNPRDSEEYSPLKMLTRTRLSEMILAEIPD